MLSRRTTTLHSSGRFTIVVSSTATLTTIAATSIHSIYGCCSCATTTPFSYLVKIVYLRLKKNWGFQFLSMLQLVDAVRWERSLLTLGLAECCHTFSSASGTDPGALLDQISASPRH